MIYMPREHSKLETYAIDNAGDIWNCKVISFKSTKNITVIRYNDKRKSLVVMKNSGFVFLGDN